MKNINWVLYARKSSEDTGKQIQSIDDQIKVLEEIAERENLKICKIIFESKSAKEPYIRNGFKELTDLVEEGKVGGILVWKLDRLSRNPIDSGKLQYLLQKKKILCIKTSEKNYLPEDNALLMSVENGMSNQYVRDLSTNVKRGMKSKAEKGWFPNTPPIGYLNSKLRLKGEETILEDEKNFPIVRKMWDLMLTGNYTIPKIHEIATKQWGLRTPNRRKLGGRVLAMSYMYKLFTNIFYTGNFVYGDKMYVGKHKAMITMDEFDRVQIIMGKRGKPRPKNYDFPFTGMMTCVGCGGVITATQKQKLIKSTGEIKTYVYYHCTKRIRDNSCKLKYLRAEDFEKQVYKILTDNYIDPDFYKLGLEVLKENHAEETNTREKIYQSQLKIKEDIQRKLDNALKFLLDGTITKEQYDSQKDQLEKELLKQDSKIRDLDTNYKDGNQLTENAFIFLQNAREAFQSDDVQVKKEILSALGLNQRLQVEKLFIDIHSWISEAKKGELELLPEIKRFELEKSFAKKGEKAPNGAFLPSLCAVIYQVRTDISNSKISYIPDLSMGLRKM